MRYSTRTVASLMNRVAKFMNSESSRLRAVLSGSQTGVAADVPSLAAPSFNAANIALFGSIRPDGAAIFNVRCWNVVIALIVAASHTPLTGNARSGIRTLALSSV
ncbi:MAG: hypothetical protein WA324_01655 [Bryobacteraceae bacterium]